MIHFITEGGNKELKNKKWNIPDGVLKHLNQVKKDNKKSDLTGNATTKEAYDHLEFILNSDNLSYNEMKRIKNWFDKNKNGKKTKQYELYGGSIMNAWVNNALNTARYNVKTNKEGLRAAGINTREKDERDTETTISKVNDYNPTTGTKNSNLKELINLKEEKIVILTENQIDLLKKYYL